MDHETFENEMIETVNQHGDSVIYTETQEKSSPVTKKNDARIVFTGLKRTLVALMTVAFFALAVLGFIAVAKMQGYMAVLVFFASVVSLLGSFTFLYAQGIVTKILPESKGDDK